MFFFLFLNDAVSCDCYYEEAPRPLPANIIARYGLSPFHTPADHYILLREYIFVFGVAFGWVLTPGDKVLVAARMPPLAAFCAAVYGTSFLTITKHLCFDHTGEFHSWTTHDTTHYRHRTQHELTLTQQR